MIGTKTAPLAALEKAIAALDFSADNAEIARLKGEVSAITAKHESVRAEVSRLANEIRDYAGPEPDAVAAAILSGASMIDSATAGTSKETLAARRDALAGSLDPLMRKVDDLRRQIAEAEGRVRLRIFEAAKPFLADLGRQQREAAETILKADAAIKAIDGLCRCFAEQAGPSRKAVEGITGADTLLGWRDRVSVPEEVLAAFAPVSQRCEALPGLSREIVSRWAH